VGVSLSEQARCFLASLLLGFILSLLYDLLRAVRLRRATKRRFTSALDLLYCAAFALLTFLFALRIGGGGLRLSMRFSALQHCGTSDAIFRTMIRRMRAQTASNC